MKYEQYIEDDLIKGLMAPVLERFNKELNESINRQISSILDDDDIKRKLIEGIVHRVGEEITRINFNYENRTPMMSGLQSMIVEKVAERVTDQELKSIIIAGLIRK